MRVVAGIAGGIPLKIPKHDLRPTMDKVRGAIFSSLGEAVVEAHVLDLFSGTGAMGIEAMSRGAASAILVESNVRALDCIRANLDKARVQAAVNREDVFRFLKRNTNQFDLIFADPPYAKAPGDQDFCHELLHSEDLLRAMTPSGILVLERAPTVPPPASSLFQLMRSRRYGASEILFLSR